MATRQRKRVRAAKVTPARFVQIISHSGSLYALDVDGIVWRRDLQLGWMKQVMDRN